MSRLRFFDSRKFLWIRAPPPPLGIDLRAHDLDFGAHGLDLGALGIVSGAHAQMLLLPDVPAPISRFPRVSLDPCSPAPPLTNAAPVRRFVPFLLWAGSCVSGS